MSEREALRALVEAVAPLMDRETVQPYIGAWEIDEPLDGEELHARLAEAYEAAKALLEAPEADGPKVTITVHDVRPPEPVVRYVPVWDPRNGPMRA